LNLKTQNRKGWLVASGAEAVADESWYLSVISGQTQLDDWTFISPRIKGLNPPSKYKQMSLNRAGTNNPAVKAINFQFSIEEVRNFLLSLTDDFIANETMCFEDIKPIVENKFPKFSFMFADRGYRSFKQLFLGETGIDAAALSKLLMSHRGRRISAGQLASPVFREKAAFAAAKLCSVWRISFPQRVLYELIKTLDPLAVLEHRVEKRSYDIYSPAIAGLIEMHGDFWHSIGPNSKKMSAVIEKNIINDEFKALLAKKHELLYIVFWHSKWESWPEKIFELYGTYPKISIQEAENQVNKTLGTKRCLRH